MMQKNKNRKNIFLRIFLGKLPLLLIGMLVLFTGSAVAVRGQAEKQVPLDKEHPCNRDTISLTTAERAWIKEHSVIRAWVGAVPPYHFWDNGPKGISVDILETIAGRLGIQVEYQQGTSQSVGLEKLRNRDGVDLLLSANRTREQNPLVSFSKNYLHFACVLFTRHEENTIFGMHDLVGKTIVMVKGCPMQKKLTIDFPGIRHVLVNDVTEALTAVSEKRVDCFVGNLGISQYRILQLGFSNLKVAAPSGVEEQKAFAVRNDWALFAAILDKGLAAISPQERTRINGNYFTAQLAHDVNFTRFWHGMQRLGIAPDNQSAPIRFSDFVDRYLFVIMMVLTLVTIMMIGVFIYFQRINRRLRREVIRRVEAEGILSKKHQDTRFWLETLMEYSPDIICFKDGAGRWLDANPADLELFQLEGVDYRGKTDSELAEFTHPLYREAFLGCEASDQETWAGGEVARSVEVIPTPGGEDVPLDVIKLPLFDEQHNPSGLLVIGRDITEHIAIKEDLQNLNYAYQLTNKVRHALLHADTEEELLDEICRLVIEQKGYCLAWIGRKEMDENHSVLPVAMAGLNQEYLKDLVITWDDLETGQGPAGKSIRSGEVVHVHDIMEDPAFLPWRERADKLGFRSVIGLPVRVEKEIWGALVIYATCADPFTSSETELLKGLVEDVGFGIGSLQIREQRKLAAQQLAESREQLALALEVSNLGTWDWRPQTDELYTNDLFLTLLGHHTDIGFPETIERWSSLVHPDDLELTREILQCYIDGDNGCYRAEYRMRTADDQWKWILDVGRVVARNGQGKAVRFMGVHIDITEQKNIEQQLIEAQQKAEAANQAKSVFLANMSHELRTPMTAILGFSELLAGDDSLQPDQHKKIVTIYRSGAYLLEMINDVLDLSKIEAGRLVAQVEEFDLHELMRDLAAMFQLRTEGEAVRFSMELNEQLPCYVKTDRKKMRQVLVNLLGNAVKFTDKGSVTLRAWVGRPGDGSYPEHLYFEIRDTGRGISLEEEKILFQPFVQASEGIRKDQGTGLGLTISRSFARLLGGDITVSSELGRESTFRFHLPIQVAEQCSITHRYRRVSGLAPGQGQYRILICDDHEESLELLKNWLQPAGFTCQTAANGSEAVEIWRQWRPHFIWMDMRMPTMDGYAATKVIRAEPGGDKTIIVALSADAFIQSGEAMMEIGCDDFVTKPCDAQTFYEVMKKHLGVRYVYEEDKIEAAKEVKQPVAVDLETLPPEIREQLHEAVTLGDPKLLTQAVAAINKYDQSLTSILQQWVDDYEYERILQLLR